MSALRSRFSFVPMCVAGALLQCVAADGQAQSEQAPSSGRAANAPQVVELEEVIVTGSRIRRTAADPTLPTLTLDQQTIDSRGYFNVGEALLDQPVFSSRSNSDTRFNQAREDIGFTFIDLFGLGSQRTLTLVDGKRVVSSASPQPSRGSGASGLQVDVNMIPSALIERVETITIGGAPIYGADAIAGTVNVILKKQFEGVELDSQSGIAEEGDAENHRLRATLGHNFLEDRANVVLAAEYSKRDGLLQTDRPGAHNVQITNPLLATDPVGFFTTVPQPPLNTYQLDTAFPGVSLYGSPASPAIAGAFGTGVVFGDTPLGFAGDAAGQTLMFDASGELIPVPVGRGNGTFLFTQDQADFPGLMRPQAYARILNGSERKSVSSLGSLQLNDNVRLTYRANYSNLDASTPVNEPITLGTPIKPGMTVSIHNPFLSPTARATLRSAQTNLGGPVLPFLFTGDSFVLGKALAEFGTQGHRAESENFSVVTGAEGELGIGERRFSWDLSYSYGKTDTSNSLGDINASAFALAQDAVMVDAGGTILTDSATFAPPSSFQFDQSAGGYVDATTGQRILCRSRVTGASGGSSCLPFNPFGARNPREVIDALAVESVIDTDIEQQFVQGNVSGAIATLPAGDLSVALGFEHRTEKAAFAADELTLAGGLLGSSAATTPVSGKFDSDELNFEAVVPLLSEEIVGSPLVKLLQFEGAIRYIDNSRAGADTVWTAGGRWEIGDSFAIRGNRTRSVRAPAIAELFSGSVPVAVSVADPCAVSQITQGQFTENRRANCIQAAIAAGRAADEAAAATFLQSFNGAIGTVPGTIGGNPDLENETADAWTIGLSFRPTFLPGFAASVDWSEIRLDGAISELGGSELVAACFDSADYPDNPTCGNFTRNDAFNLSSYRAGFVNTGFIDFAALTASAQYVASVGRGDLSVTGTLFKLDHYRLSTDGTNVSELRDTVSFERYRAQLALGYTLGAFTASLNTQYVPGAWLFASDRDGLSNTFEFPRAEAQALHSLSLLYRINDAFKVRLVVNNLTDEAQPNPLIQFAAVQARIGRTYLVGLNASF